MKKNLIVTAVATLAASFATAASAQSSVTLYGLVDAGLTYVNNVRNETGESAKASSFGVTSGNVNPSRWGLRGAEDLGGGMKAVFTLENGFNIANGTGDGRQFGRQAYVGLSTAQVGTLTLGRQNDAVADFLGPMSATGTWGGTYFAHPGDIDNLDGNAFRINNSVKFVSANYAGLTFAGAYGFSNSAGSFAANRAYSFGAGYANGPFKLGAAYTQANGFNSNTAGAITESVVSPIIAGAQQTARLRTFGAGGSFSTGPMTFGAVWTQTRSDNDSEVVADSSSIANNYEINGRYALTPALSLGAAYTFTYAKTEDPRAESRRVRRHQFGLQTDYALSKRTDIYAEGVVQIASGGGEGVYPAAGINGADTSSSSRQVLVTTGIRHRF
ncbi:porin [Caballeronia pedi]|uniref:Porin n=1 Tax=Caballeronia pedi TaxID=1777141 RepID=A0A157Z370_9BURK|nr:porin [Caballeronia pedi]SAK40005.1 porin [Caballeronia pedi]